MAKKLIIPIVADDRLWKSGLKSSTMAANEFETKIKRTTSHVRSHILGLGAAFVGVGGLVEGIKVSIEAADDLEKSTRGLDAQLRANHESLRAIQPQLASLGSAMAKVGYTNSQTEQAFTRLDRASGSSAAAFKYMGVTADLAAAKHIDLAQAALLIGKVMTGTTSALNRYGIAIPKGTSATEALAIAQQKLAGQAEAGATPMMRFHATLTNMEATIGQALMPTIAKYLDKVSEWFSKTENQRKVTDAVKTVLHDLGVVLGTVKDAFDRIWPIIVKVKNAFGDWKPLIVAAGAALVALGLLSPWTALAIGAVYVITHWEKVKGWFEAFWVTIRKGFATMWDALKIDALLAAKAEVEPFSHLPGKLGEWARKAKDALDAKIGSIHNDMQSNIDSITGAWGKGGKDAATAWKDAYAASIAKSQAGFGPYVPGTHGTQMSTPNNPGGYQLAPDRVPGTNVTGNAMSAGQVRALVLKAGGTAKEAAYLAAISGKESGRQPGIINDNLKTHDYSVGLFQINFRDMKNRWMRGGKSAALALQQDPLAQARYALSLLHSQGPSAWSTNTPAIQALLGGSAGGGSGVSLPGDAAASSAREKKAAAAAKAAASAAYRAWKENYFTPLDNQYKSDLLITDESKRMNRLEALHAKLAIDLKNTRGKEHQDILNEENKVAGKIMSLRQKMAAEQKAIIARQHAAYVKGLQDDLAAAQKSLSTQQTLFDRAFSRIAAKLTGSLQAKYAAATPEEQARDAFQAQLDAAQKAADLSSAQNDLVAAQLSGDPAAVKAAQAHLGDVQNQQKLADLQDAADKSRVIQDAAGQTALDNLNDWLADQKTALEGGTQTWDGFWQAAFSDAPQKYAPDAVSSLQGVLDQMARIKALQDAINGTSTPLPNVSSGLAGSYFMLNPQIPHFAKGGVMPGAYGQPGLAVLHGGEHVIPNGAAGGNTYHFTFPNYVGDRGELERFVTSAVVKANRKGNLLTADLR